MNLIFIYGPPAAGKLTVANEIAKINGYRVFHNHTLVGSVASLFPFGDKSSDLIRKRLAGRFRLELFKEAARNDVNMITTFGGGDKERLRFFKKVEKAIEGLGGNVYFIHLQPSKEALFERVTSTSRKGIKIDNKKFLKKLLDEPNRYYKSYAASRHLVIDNTKMTAKAVAKKIVGHYGLE